MPTIDHYQQVLQSVGEPFTVLPLQGDASVLITRRGGRVLGLFPAPDADNLFWTSSAFESSAAFRAFIERKDGWHWNLGGDRTWIAPEFAYNARDRRNFSGTWTIPHDMDPGMYTITYTDGRIALTTEMMLPVYHHGEMNGETRLTLQKTIYAAPVVEESNGVISVGYVSESTLTQHGDAPIASHAWHLLQVHPGGTLIIPVRGEFGAADYVAPVPVEARQVVDGAVRLSIGGAGRFKVGYDAACMTGRMIYRQPMPDGRVALLVREFENDPANPYLEEPPDSPGVGGHSVHVYNNGDDPANDPSFGEMECAGRTVGRATGHTSQTDTVTLSMFVGEATAIDRIIDALVRAS
ncbi:MAG: hypothetical protein HC828_14140 [Blastochloris sp.]|nr:hypothetical protein [Blastochloris sp.]